MVSEDSNLLNENIKRIGNEISNLKKSLDSENLKLVHLRNVMKDLLYSNDKNSYSNEFGRFQIYKRKLQFRKNLKPEIENEDESFLKELLNKGFLEIEQKYVLNFESDVLNNEEVLKKLDKYLLKYGSENFLTYSVNKTEKLKKIEIENTLKVCENSKLLKDSCTQVCCTDDNLCIYCGEVYDEEFEPDCCDDALEDFREESEEAEELQNELLRELYETGLEYLNTEEMDISEYERD
jgi:hypothetical protein